MDQVNSLDKNWISDRITSVLIAEDNPANMLLTEKLIGKFVPGATFIRAKNGKAAVEFYEKLVPDIIFMDIQMPVLSGYEATSIIRNRYHDHKTPIIALTAGTIDMDQENSMNSGMNAYLAKPTRLSDMERVLREFVG